MSCQNEVVCRDYRGAGEYEQRYDQRYIRLTKLIKPLLNMVDEGKIALTPAEKLSYLTEEEQTELVKQIGELEGF